MVETSNKQAKNTWQKRTKNDVYSAKWQTGCR